MGVGRRRLPPEALRGTAGILAQPDLFFNSSVWDWLSSFPDAKVSSQQVPRHTPDSPLLEEGRSRMSLGCAEHLYWLFRKRVLSQQSLVSTTWVVKSTAPMAPSPHPD